MRAGIHHTATAALDELLAVHDNEPLQVAETLGINNAHVYIYRKHGRITPKLRKCLEEYHYIPKPPKRYRLHIECGRGDPGARRKAQMQAWLAARGYDNVTQFMDAMMEQDGGA